MAQLNKKYIKYSLFPEEMQPGQQCYISEYDLWLDEKGELWLKKDATCLIFPQMGWEEHFPLLKWDGKKWDVLLTVPSGWRMRRSLTAKQELLLPLGSVTVVEQEGLDSSDF